MVAARLFWHSFRGWLILTSVVVALLLTEKSMRRYGDTLQVALPAAAFLCSRSKAEVANLATRFFILEAVVHGSKNLLGSTEINKRPNGKYRGFPSGHTAAATFGASSLIHSCLKKNPIFSLVAATAAGFVGTSRVQSGKHNLLQVMAGLLIGWLCERLFAIFSLFRRWCSRLRIPRRRLWVKSGKHNESTELRDDADYPGSAQNHSILTKRHQINFFLFVTVYVSLNMVLFQGPLLNYVFGALDIFTFQGMVQLISIEVLQFVLAFGCLTLAGFLPLPIFKSLCVLFLICNAAASYFMTIYGIELDRTMIGNILNTDGGEAFQLWHPQLLLQVLIFAGIPAFVIYRMDIVKPSWSLRVGSLMVAAITMVSWIYIISFTWLWFDQHLSRLGGRILPWSYVVNTIRYIDQAALAQREQVLLPKASFTHRLADGERDIVVLVIGEAARAQNFSYYGYHRDTNAFTRETSMLALPSGLSCATYTIASVACILTHEGSDASPRTSFEPLPSYLTRHGVETIFLTNNSGAPPVNVSNHIHARHIVAGCKDSDCSSHRFDEALLWGLEEKLKTTSSSRVFVTLHLSGSHGPAYHRQYPPEFERFKPVCNTVQISKCSQAELINAYDNTILYTDYLIAELIRTLARIPDARSSLIYVSDHGQSLGENGLYLHGSPIVVAPDVQRRIPFLVWTSNSFKTAHNLMNEDIQRSHTKPHDFVFHSVMGAFGITSRIYQAEHDIFANRKGRSKESNAR